MSCPYIFQQIQVLVNFLKNYYKRHDVQFDPISCFTEVCCLKLLSFLFDIYHVFILLDL